LDTHIQALPGSFPGVRNPRVDIRCRLKRITARPLCTARNSVRLPTALPHAEVLRREEQFSFAPASDISYPERKGTGAPPRASIKRQRFAIQKPDIFPESNTGLSCSLLREENICGRFLPQERKVIHVSGEHDRPGGREVPGNAAPEGRTAARAAETEHRHLRSDRGWKDHDDQHSLR